MTAFGLAAALLFAAPVGAGRAPTEAGAAGAAQTTPAAAKPKGLLEPYLATGFSYYASDRRVIAGVGGGLGLRVHVHRLVSLYGEGRYFLYTGNSVSGALGASTSFALGPLAPLAGLQATFYGGDSVQVIDSARPVPLPALAWAVQARLAPLRLVHAPFTVTALSGDVGLGIDGKSRALAVTITWLDIGFRF